MWSLLTVLALFVGAVSSSPRANQYIETVLNNALQQQIRMQKLDPAPLSNFATEFYDTVKILGKVKGKGEFSQGTLTGLSKVYRFSECKGPHFNPYGQKHINCTIAFDHLKISYNGKVKYGKVPKVNTRGDADVTATLIFIEVVDMNMRTTLRGMSYQQIGQMNVKFSGLGPLNRFLNPLVEGYKVHVQSQLTNSIAQRFQQALGQAVSMVPMPN